MTEYRFSQDIRTLLAIMKVLRSPQGCPWDREQTSASLIPYTLEEAYEVADAIESGQENKICEELGDLLLQIVFLSQMAEEQGQFNFGDVVLTLSEKLVRRHPHIFSDVRAETAGEVSIIWAEVKEKEHEGTQRPKIPPLPGFLLLEKLARKFTHSVDDPLIQQLLVLTEEAHSRGSNLETEIRRFYANFCLGGQEFQ